ncbi:MAG: hypothetical protein CMI58_04665 [Parcubacteria group bacterium]|nr:hypothetical protein [Parcubacteria group bacterium]|tara:strand:- start:8363 stop:8599 length:237 start_codon:yes stop_codon:yes gene_type:complete
MEQMSSEEDLVEATLGTVILVFAFGLGVVLWQSGGGLGLASWYLWGIVLIGVGVGLCGMLHGIRTSWPWFPDSEKDWE